MYSQSTTLYISAAASSKHTLLVDQHGQVYAMGENKNGVLGNTSKKFGFHKQVNRAPCKKQGWRRRYKPKARDSKPRARRKAQGARRKAQGTKHKAQGASVAGRTKALKFTPD